MFRIITKYFKKLLLPEKFEIIINTSINLQFVKEYNNNIRYCTFKFQKYFFQYFCDISVQSDYMAE